MSPFRNRALPAELLRRGRGEQRIAEATDVPSGTVIEFGDYAVGNHNGEYFAVSRSCRHLLGDLAKGSIDRRGCLVCPIHGSRYDVKTGRMVSGPRGIYARVPGLGASFIALTKVLPLLRRRVVEKDGTLYLA